METFTLDPRSWLIYRVIGRNPLIRGSDRIEALVILVAIVVSLIAVPVAGVVGATAYSTRNRLYTQETQTRHAVTATVTDATITPGTGTVVLQARWRVAAGEHTGSLPWNAPIRADEHIEIWVDTDGNPVDPPTPRSSAVLDAVGTTMAIVVMVAIAMPAFVAAVGSRLDRARDAQWEHEIDCLEDDDGGRTNQH